MQFKIEFLLPFTSCKKVLGKMVALRLISEEQQKYLQSFINNATYHPMNPDADVTYQTVNLCSSDKCFICFISDCPHYIQ